ncbi:hypothetical protein [Nocardia rhizosphaerae]|uniref:Rad52/22 family double-strand break repair protein n=1 Tax=Nocardia rhizosphaerae TaxID=1691571 RepID=A0ABV8L3N8_9NOCA
MTSPTGLAKMREPFPEHQVSQLPKPFRKDSEKGRCRECGGFHGLPAVHLDYVGHAALTDRLLDADPEWMWEPVAFDEAGLPRMDRNGGLWIRLTVAGVTRYGYGDADGKSGGNAIKEAIGDALRNAAMRFGAALDLWHKGDLHEAEQQRGREPHPADVAREELLELLRAKGIDPGEAVAEFAQQKNGADLRTTEDAAALRELIQRYKEAQ